MRNTKFQKMSFKSFLLKEGGNNVEFLDHLEQEEFDQFISDIKRDCSQFINNPTVRKNYLKNGKFLLRGVSLNNIPRFIGKQIRKDRTPRDSSNEYHKMMNDVFNKKFGIDLRSNSLFATVDFSTAEEYGTLVILFPVNNSRYFFSKKVDDLFSDFSNRFRLSSKLSRAFGDDLYNALIKYKIINPKLIETIKKYLSEDTDELSESIKLRLVDIHVKFISNCIRRTTFHKLLLDELFNSISDVDQIFFSNIGKGQGIINTVTELVEKYDIFSNADAERLFPKLEKLLEDQYDTILGFEEYSVDDVFINILEGDSKEIMIYGDYYYAMAIKQEEVHSLVSNNKNDLKENEAYSILQKIFEK